MEQKRMAQDGTEIQKEQSDKHQAKACPRPKWLSPGPPTLQRRRLDAEAPWGDVLLMRRLDGAAPLPQTGS